MKVGILLGNISESGGTERAVSNLANILVQFGNYEVNIISEYSSENDKAYYKLEDSIKVVHLGFQRTSIVHRLFSYKQLQDKLSKIISTFRLDALVGTTHAYNCIISRLHDQCLTVGCEHMNYQACKTFWRAIRKHCYPRLSAVVVLTNKDSQNYSFVQKGRLFVIPNSLSFTNDKIAQLENHTILAVGRLCEQKDFSKIIEVAEIVRHELPDWKFKIFGDGPDKDKLENEIFENNLQGYVTIYPPTKTIINEYASSSMLAVTSRWEGFSMVILEAEECGLPIVSFNCNYGPSDLVDDGDNGFLIAPGDIHDFAEKVIKLATDKNRRQKMGRNSFERSKNYTPAKVYEKWNDLFDQISNL